jgi:hypothetical protein
MDRVLANGDDHNHAASDLETENASAIESAIAIAIANVTMYARACMDDRNVQFVDYELEAVAQQVA